MRFSFQYPFCYQSIVVSRQSLVVSEEGLSSAKHETRNIELKIVSNALGEELEKVWEWCDVLVLPTLSENFGLVVAEALERGKRVITTDGAPAWGDGNDYGERLVYLKGYRDGREKERIKLLKDALMMMVG
jgi:glycosyltransferase involved in cell wall biosynthesis